MLDITNGAGNTITVAVAGGRSVLASRVLNYGIMRCTRILQVVSLVREVVDVRSTIPSELDYSVVWPWTARIV